jgi:hypothetical protein
MDCGPALYVALDHDSFRGGVAMPSAEMFKGHECGRQFTGLELPDIVHLRIQGRCTLEECKMINRAHLEYAEDVSYFFYLIDLSELEDLPAAVRKEASATVKLLPLRGTVVCNAPLRARVLAKLLLTAANLASSLFGKSPASNPVVFADSEEEGRAWIDQRRRQLAEAAA